MITTISVYEFCNWFRESDNYKNNFTKNGLLALFDYLEELESDTGEPIEFDPIAIACEYSEYASFDDFQHDIGYVQDGKEHLGYPEITDLEDLRDHTTVIEFDDGIIIGDF